jgi:hypothetical protein
LCWMLFAIYHQLSPQRGRKIALEFKHLRCDADIII